MRWLYMLASAVAAALFYGTAVRGALFLSLVVLSVSFASFCLLYDEPLKRAKRRTEVRLGEISGKGVHAEEYQRLQSMPAAPSDDDRRFRLTMMSGINIASGIAGAALLVWAIVARVV